MNPPEKKSYNLGQPIRNICDELINEMNEGVIDMANNKGPKQEKIRDFKDKIKGGFHPLIKQAMKSLKGIIKLDENDKAFSSLNEFYEIIDKILNNLLFLNNMTDVYIFPEFNINDTVDLIFEGCSNNLRQKLIESQLLDLILSKNLYDNNDVRFLINNDLNNIDYNNPEGNTSKNINNVLLDKNNQITKNIINNIENKFDEFNKFVISKKEGFNEYNFKLYLDGLICLKLYNNFEIKFTIAQLRANTYFILPIELQYNNQKINLNDKEEKYFDKDKLLSKNDLFFFINKFILKNDNSNFNDIKIDALNQTDFLEKCLLFKQYTDEFFNDKFENIKKELQKFLDKYDYPIKIEDKNNGQMEVDNIKKEENEYNEINIVYNFSIAMKKKKEFYIKLIQNKKNPTRIKMVFSHYILKTNLNDQNNQRERCFLIIEEKENILDLDMKIIKKVILDYYENYSQILMNWIAKKLRYIYPIYFDITFKLEKFYKQISFGLKYKEDTILKYFYIFINDKGKLSYENLFSSKLIGDDFKEINNILTNYLKCDEEDEKFNEYIIQFNEYIKYLTVEKVFKFTEDKIKLIELDNNTKIMNIQVYNSYNTDKNISSYFDIKCNIFGVNSIINNKFKISEIKLICFNNKNSNKKIILNCKIKRYLLDVDLNYEYEKFFRTLFNELKTKYEVCINCFYDFLQYSENQNNYLELKAPLILDENKITDNKNDNQWIELSNDFQNLDIFQNEFKQKFMKYFKKIKFSMQNNIYKFYLNDKAFKGKKQYLNFKSFFIENYSTMMQNILLGYELNEDAISLTIMEKLKVGYFNKIQTVFEVLSKCIFFMDNIFKFVDYLLINEPVPIIRLCPIFFILQIKHGNFVQHLNFKFHLEKEPYLSIDGNFNSLFQNSFRIFGERLILNEYDYNDKKYLKNKAKNFYMLYQIFDLLINQYKCKVSMIEYPYNHLIQRNSNIYFISKDYNVINLMSLNNLILTLQILNDSKLYLEFRDNNRNSGNNKYSIFLKSLEETNREYNVNQNNENNTIAIWINDENEEETISKFKEIIKIFNSLSNN